jgi:putative endonuclease
MTLPPSPDARSTGRDAEAHAAAFLRRQGFHIVETNVRYPVGEIDIVADDAGVLVFVEVRARRPGPYGTAAETVDRRKRARILRAAETYLQQRAVDPGRACRIDVVAIRLDARGKPAATELIRNAFGE